MTWEMAGKSLIEKSGLVDYKIRSRGRTVTESDFTMMTNLTWTTGELHTNEDVAGNLFGSRILAAPAILAFALGLSTPAVLPEVTRCGVSLLAIVGYEEVRFRAPLRPGTTIYAEVRVAEIVGTSRQGRAVMSLDETVVNQDDEVLVTYIRKALCEGSFND